MNLTADPVVVSLMTTAIGALGAVFGGLVFFAIRGIWRSWPWTRVDIAHAEARYLVPGIRMRYHGESESEPVIFDYLESDVAGALLLEVPVRFAALNPGPVAETVIRGELWIGDHDGNRLMTEGLLPDGGTFSGCEVPAHHGFRHLDLVFRLGSDRFAERGAWDYSLGSRWIVSILTSKRRLHRFELTVKPGKPASVSSRRLHFWERPRLAQTQGASAETEAA